MILSGMGHQPLNLDTKEARMDISVNSALFCCSQIFVCNCPQYLSVRFIFIVSDIGYCFDQVHMGVPFSIDSISR